MASSIKVAAILDKVRAILQDKNAKRRSDADLLRWLNMVRRQIVMYKPNACTENTTITLVQGPRQTGTGAAILEVTRNLATGAVMRKTARDVLDGLNKAWQSASYGSPSLYCIDDHDPNVFWVYPPAKGTETVAIVQSVLPADVTVDAIQTATIGMSDIYEAPLVDGICAKAFSEETSEQNINRANLHMQAFFAALNAKAQTDAAIAKYPGEVTAGGNNAG